jgi:ATP-dependent DNA helicase RecQ
MTVRDEAERVLKQLAGHAAQLRDDQWTAIDQLVVSRRRVLCVQRTGWGKSAVYFVATALLRARGAGPTVIISPLLALMRNQIEAASRTGIHAVTINSSNLAEWHDVYDRVQDGTVDVLLVSPERLNNPSFRDYVLPELAKATGLVVVDEAHCISDWGHDFRPDYRRIRTLLAELSPKIPVLATTATANSRVVTDVAEQLGDAYVVRGSLDRESLRLAVVHLPTPASRLAWMAEHLPTLPGSGIVYTLTVSAAESAATFLRSRGCSVVAYTSKVENLERQAAENDLIRNDVKALVATSALGMGFDKSDLGFVVHLGAPPSPIAYYQQIGRAGRAVEEAQVILLPGSEDAIIWRYFTMLAFPAEEQVRTVLDILSAGGAPISTQALETRVDLGRRSLEHMLRVLDVDGAVRRVEGGWVSTAASWRHDHERYERISAARLAEQEAMLRYVTTTDCRLEFLRRCLDDADAAPCGRCDNCTGEFLSTTVSGSALEAARAHYDSIGVDINPRTQWPTGLPAIGIPLSGRIPAGERALVGRAVARLDETGWGDRLRPLFEAGASDAALSNRLLNGAIQVMNDWTPPGGLRPGAVIAMGSRQRPRLVRGLAERIAQECSVPLLGTLPAVDSPPGAGRANSARRVAALHAAINVPPSLGAACPRVEGPVLLVDDLVDSGWTMTLAARVLRRAGATDVLPFALAVTGRRD